jgi:hypothetical protein
MCSISVSRVVQKNTLTEWRATTHAHDRQRKCSQLSLQESECTIGTKFEKEPRSGSAHDHENSRIVPPPVKMGAALGAALQEEHS